MEVRARPASRSGARTPQIQEEGELELDVDNEPWFSFNGCVCSSEKLHALMRCGHTRSAFAVICNTSRLLLGVFVAKCIDTDV